MGSSAVPIEKIKENMRAMWMAGDFGVVAKTVARSGEGFVEKLEIEPGMRVLDVACGTGNLAIPLARKGALVTGIDIAPNLVAQARARAEAERLAIEFHEGDAEAMPYRDGTFDLVVSMFGAMFAPRPEVVAREMARVLHKAGTLAMANWNPASFTGKMFRVGAQHVPPPPGVAPPSLWGDDETVRERLAPYFDHIRTQVVPIDFDLPVDPAGAVEFFRTYFGPTQVAFNRLDGIGQEAMRRDLVELWTEANVAPDPDKHTLIRNQYLEVVARKK